jgi:hypothetical protein
MVRLGYCDRLGGVVFGRRTGAPPRGVPVLQKRNHA